MRALLPEPADDVDVHDFYGRDWLGTGGVRANMIASVDGAAAADGKSAGLQTPGDNTVFAALRALADTVLVGSATARTEGYGRVDFDGAAAERRRADGFSVELPIALVSRSLRLDTGSRIFHDNRPIVVTCASADAEARDALRAYAAVLVCGEDEIDFGEARRQLAERGLTRVLCEGGPTILGLLMAAGQLDELCLTLAPMATGPGADRIVSGTPWPGGPIRYDLAGLLEEDGALFIRLTRASASERN